MKNDFKSCPYNTTQLFNQKSTFVYDDDGNIIAENIKNITINKPTKCTKKFVSVSLIIRRGNNDTV